MFPLLEACFNLCKNKYLFWSAVLCQVVTEQSSNIATLKLKSKILLLEGDSEATLKPKSAPNMGLWVKHTKINKAL